MSYILDALRRADAERERGHVPGIHAQPLIAGAAPSAAQSVRAPWPWFAGAALVLLLGVVLAWWLTRAGSPSAGEPASRPLAAAPSAAPAPALGPAPAPRQPTAPITAVPKSEPLPVIRQTRPAAPAPSDDAKPATAAAPRADGEARIYRPAELPDEIRRQLPVLSVGGSAYSNKPVDRILILNGQVLHEGDKVTPELQLQQIKLRSAVLAFKGYRYEIVY